MKKILFLLIIFASFASAQLVREPMLSDSLRAMETVDDSLADDIVDLSHSNFIGLYAGDLNWGDLSHGFGQDALYYNSGIYVNGFGHRALSYNTGSYVNGFGAYALYSNTASTANGFGYEALYQNSGAGANGFGNFALRNNTACSANAFGDHAGHFNTGGCSDFFGVNAGFANTGDDAVIFGDDGGYWNTGLFASGFGTYTLKNNEGALNTAIGSQAFNTFNVDTANEVTFDSSAVVEQQLYLPTHGFGDDSAYVLLKYTEGTDIIGGLSDEDVEPYRGIYKFRIVTADTIEPFGFSLVEDDTINTNGVFTDSTDWTVGEHWEISSGVATYDGSYVFSVLVQSGILTSGNTYIIAFDCVADPASELHVYAGTGAIQEYHNPITSGSYVDTLVADGGDLMFGSGAANSLTIDNIVVTDMYSGAHGTGHKLTPQFIYTNSTAIGYNAEPTASNQIMLGDTNVTSVVANGYIITDSVLTGGIKLATETITDSLAADIAEIKIYSVIKTYPDSATTFTFLRTKYAITVDSVFALVQGTSALVDFNLAYGTNRTSGTNVFAASQSADNVTVGETFSSFSSASIPISNMVWLNITNTDNTPEEFICVIYYH